jgi:hypothetical protein
MKTSAICTIGLILFCILNVSGVYGAAAWEKMELVEPYKSVPIYDIWGTSDQDLYIVGVRFPEGASRGKGFVCRYNGKAWAEVASGNSIWLYDIWASSASNIFAVGENNVSSGIILHYNGSAWNETIVGNILYGIWGASATNVFAVGIGNNIHHYDGLNWTQMTTPIDNAYCYEKVWGSSASDVFAVGCYIPTGGDERYVILHYDGSEWSVMKTGAGGRLVNIWGSSASDVFAVGYPGIFHYNGKSWSVMKDNATLGAYIYSIWGSSSSNVFVGSYNGRILRYDGANWTEMESGTTSVFWNMWGLSAVNVYAVGNDGTILHYTRNEPLPPSNLSARASSSTQIVLGWKDNSNNEKGFKIEGKTGNCNSSDQWHQISDKPANKTMCTASNLKPNTAYAFRVKSYNSSGDSAYSNCVYAKTGPSGSPQSPTNLTAVSVSPTAVQLRWKDKSADEDGFKIFRKVDAGSWSLLHTTGADTVAYKDDSAMNNQSSSSYQYYICAYNASGNSPQTNAAVVAYQPTNLSAAPGASSGKVSIAWTDNSANESGFEIYRKSDSCNSENSWTRVGTAGSNRTSWTDSGLTSGNTYAYRVRAYKKSGSVLPANGYSLWSNCDAAVAP